MLFNDALDIHDSYTTKESQADILGDGFLLQTNAIYRNVKLLSLKLGCRYIEAYLEYLLLPFHELPNIVKSKKVPYVPSARLMRKVEEGRPGAFATEEVPIPESYHLHEAAHVIAECLLKDVEAASAQQQILKAILAESFANTVDALAGSQAADDLHVFFIRQNCYMHPQKKVVQAVARLNASLGFRFTFMLIFFTYVHANFLAKPLSKSARQEIMDRYALGSKPSATVIKDCQIVADIGEKLDPLFRVTTTGNYFKQQGFQGDIHDLLDFPFMKVFDGSEGFRQAVEAMCEGITP